MKIRVLSVAKKDFKDSMRAKTIWVLTALYIVVSAAWTYSIAGGFSTRVVEQGGNYTLAFLITLVVPLVAFVPLTGIVISVKSVVGEREAGTINFLMTLPYTRADVLLGKFIGRTAVLGLAIAVGFVTSAGVFAYEVAFVDPLQSVLFFLLTLLAGMVFVSLSIGVSASVDSTTRAMVIAGGVFAIIGPVWPSVLSRLPENWRDSALFVFLQRLHLEDVFTDAFLVLVGTPGNTSAETTANSLPDTVEMAVYFRNWFAFVILGLWILIPFVFGYFRFNQKEF